MSVAQDASLPETRAVTSIVECLVEGLPEDWRRVQMVVELERPGAETGSVQYLVSRAGSPDQFEAFQPCDLRKPARTLIDARNDQATDKRGWTTARLLLQRDGKFGLSYDYPKPN